MIKSHREVAFICREVFIKSYMSFYIKLKWSLNIPKVAKFGVYTEVARLKSELLVLYDREEKMWH